MLHRVFLVLVLCWQHSASSAFELTTRATSKLSASALQDFLSRPANWPRIVASSDRVESATADVNAPLKPKKLVQEFFGLGLLKVEWICRQNRPGSLVVESPDGVPGIASDCSMSFSIRDNEVELTMGYTPQSPLAALATPILIVDNWVALNVLLPAAVDPTPLESFRRLMGTLYGIAGVAHAADLWVGGSTLFTSAGIPVFADLSFSGQAYACLWCAVGPLAFFLSRKEEQIASSNPLTLADWGLIIYGGVEVLGAYLSGNMAAPANAAVVQGVVLAAWFYSYQKQQAASMV